MNPPSIPHESIDFENEHFFRFKNDYFTVIKGFQVDADWSALLANQRLDQSEAWPVRGLTNQRLDQSKT